MQGRQTAVPAKIYARRICKGTKEAQLKIHKNIDARLRAVADMICGGVIADVGSDHAYLPVWLYQRKKITKAYALDISENCINRIKFNLKRYNIPENIIIPVLSDGLSCFEGNYDFTELTDIIIAGMGGENIAGIIDKRLKTVVNGAQTAALPEKNVNFILQPNSKMKFLREFLRANEFEIIQDIVTESKKRRYIIINARLRLN